MLEDHAFEERPDDFFLFGVELRDGFELKLQFVVNATFTENPKGRLTAVQYRGGYNSSASPTCDTTFTEMYSYHDAGSILKKRLRVKRTSFTNLDLDSTYTYDTEGRNTAIQYPGTWNSSTLSYDAGPNLGVEFDSMGRLNKLKNLTTTTDIVSAATYNAMGELLTMTGVNGAPSEARSYNSLGQMTQLTSGSMTRNYTFSSSQTPGLQNNGKIISENDPASGETVTYTYDSLNRLASATSSGASPAWGQSYTYDGFGNLTKTNTINGNAPAPGPFVYDAATNRRVGESADANGNILQSGVTNYDVENRITAANITNGTARYSYAPGNKRIWRGTWVNSAQTVDELTYYSASGAKLCAYNLTVNGYGQLTATSSGYYEYFGGKLLKNAGGYVNADRLGSIGKYFPYGQERPSATANGKEKFATYTRDAETGLDYAQARYHSSGDGRFLSPDPYQASAGPSDPGSWNRYAYTRGDPVNRADPGGLKDCDINGDPTPCPEPPPLPPYDPNRWTIDADPCVFPGAAQDYPEQCGDTTTQTGTRGSRDFATAAGVLDREKKWISQNKFKKGCADVMSALGIDEASWRGAVANTVFHDGTNSNFLMADLFDSATDESVRAQGLTYGTQTISQYLASRETATGGVAAVAQLNGVNIFINHSHIAEDPWRNRAMMMHESLHNLKGLGDVGLATALSKSGFKVDTSLAGAAESVQRTIYEKCF